MGVFKKKKKKKEKKKVGGGGRVVPGSEFHFRVGLSRNKAKNEESISIWEHIKPK